ncbi:MAG: lactate utilization protein [Bacillota bacterium]
MEQKIKNALESFKKNKINARYFESSAEAVNAILADIKPDQTVGIGGSMTVKELKLDQLLKDRGNTVYFHWLEDTPEKMDQARYNARSADVFLTSTNAATEKGQLMNIDGVGNRVTSMIYGPKKVMVIFGVNKIASNLDEAMKRIKDNAYKNARRLKLNTPCAVTEKCNDCDSPQRMCNVTTIIEKKPSKTEVEVIIIGEDLGF